MHSFTGNYDQVKKILDAGFYIGVNGIITYKSAEEIRSWLKKIIGSKKLNNPVDLYKKHILINYFKKT